ncbi:sensor histidine kinase [Verrucomicrobiota bacterium sgz303538]
MTQPQSDSHELEVPFDRVATFIRQVTHDVRNNLNSMDLQSAYAVELVADPEAAEELKQVRRLIQQAAKQLQSLSGYFQVGNPNLVSYSAKIFVEDLRDRLNRIFPEQMPSVTWEDSLGDQMISVDIEMVFSAMSEIFKNSFQFREAGQPISVRTFAEGDRVILELQEGKTTVPSDPASWGQMPFVSTRRGGYGLGLFRARRILEIHGGEISASHDSARARLTTRVSLPVATES